MADPDALVSLVFAAFALAAAACAAACPCDCASAALLAESVALFAAAHAVRQVAGKLKRERSLASVGNALIPLEDYYGLVGLRAMLDREEGYDRSAASLAGRNT